MTDFAAPPSLPNLTSHNEPVKGAPHGPSLDTNALDDLGHEKSDTTQIGPRGRNVPLDVLTEAQRNAIEQKQEDKRTAAMAPTDHIDSAGNLKGHFATTENGYDKNGARIPDTVDYDVVIEERPAQVGPRGSGAPQDTFHGKRPAKR